MNNHISSSSTIKPTLSAPVVQSRLEHHHQQQQQFLSKSQKPEAKQHQRSKSVNKGKRVSSHNQSKENFVPMVSISTANGSHSSRPNTKNDSNYNYVDNFDSSHREPKHVDTTAFNFASHKHVSTLEISDNQRRSGEKRPRKHQYSDSIDEDKFRVVTPVTILKRPQSATDFVKSSNVASTSSKMFLDVTREEQYSSSCQLPSTIDHSKERRRSDATSSRVKPAQRRKDVKPIVGPQPELPEGSDVNNISNSHLTEPTCLSKTPPQTTSAFVFPPLNYSNAIIALEEEMSNGNKQDVIDMSNMFERPLVKGSKRRSDIFIPVNSFFVPESTPRRQSSTAIELQNQVAPFAIDEYESSFVHPSSRRLSVSPSRAMASKLYAGPTFHNSPAPSDLPLPSFLSKPSSKESSPYISNATLPVTNIPSRVPSPSLSSGNSSDDEMFVMDDIETDVNKYYGQSNTLRKQKSRELLRILSANQTNSAAAYMVPERMATSHNPALVYPATNGLSLTEISESLRTLLKIHGQ